MTENLSPSEFACVQALMYFGEYANLEPDTSPVFTNEAFMKRRIKRNGGVAPPSGHADLPCTVYVLFAENKKYIYVGMSMVPFLRWLEHDLNYGSKASTVHGPWDTAVHFNCENRDEASTLERYLHIEIDKARAIVEAAFDYPKGSLAKVEVLEAKENKKRKGIVVNIGDVSIPDEVHFASQRVEEFLTQKQT